MPRFLLLLLPAALWAQPLLRVEPALATVCSSTEKATLTLRWSAAEPARIHVVSASGSVPMTGDLPLAGTTATGPWATDGLTFVLVSLSGTELARAQARVHCVSPRPDSLFPLQLGYEWTYRTRSRVQTGQTLTLAVTEAAESAGDVWFRIPVLGWLREDGDGRIWRRPTLDAEASVWVDSAAARRAVSGPLGEFLNAVQIVDSQSLVSTRRVFAPGVGLVSLDGTLLTGSSGGFTDGWELVAYRQGDTLREEADESSLRLASEATTFDVTGRAVSNCAVPCYFVACYLAPGADPPGTYKPCFRAHATARSASPGATVELRLLNDAGAELYRAAQPLTAGARLQRQVPVAQPPGSYRLEGRVLRGDGSVEQTSVITLTVQ